MSINYLDKTGLEHIGDIANYKKRNIDYTTYTGTDLEIEDTLENKINFNNLYGQTEQDGTPTPTNPIEIKTVTGRQVVKITGKNLLDASQGKLGTFNNLTISYSNGNILLNGTSTALVDFYVGTSAYNTDLVNYMNNNLGTYTLSNNLGFENYFRIGGSYLQNQGTITSSNKVDLIFIRIPTGTYDNEILNIQIEKNSTTTEYEGYKEQSYELNLGKNLFDKDNMPVLDLYIENGIIKESSYNKMIYIPCKPNTTYTLQKIASAYSRQIAYTTELPAANVSVYGRVEIPANNTQSKITTGSDAKYLVCRFYQVTQDANISLQQMLDSIMIEKGGEATSYSPYFTPIELCKIGDYRDSIKKSTGKNLFDKSAVTLGKIVSRTDGTLSNAANYNASDYIPMKENTTYTLTARNFNRWYSACYDENKNYIGYVENEATFTTISGTKYMRFTVYNGLMDTAMINEGSTALPYEPYGVGKWYVEKKIGKVVLDGSENWSRYIEGDFYMHYVSNIINSTGDYSLALSNYYQNTQYYPATENLFCIRASGTSLYFENNIETTDGFKTWLSTHNVEVYYILATSTAEEITDGELIEQLNDLYEAFYMNSKTYINVEGDLPTVLEINHDKPRFLNLIDKGELQKYIIDLEKRVAIYWNHK